MTRCCGGERVCRYKNWDELKVINTEPPYISSHEILLNTTNGRHSKEGFVPPPKVTKKLEGLLGKNNLLSSPSARFYENSVPKRSARILTTCHILGTSFHSFVLFCIGFCGIVGRTSLFWLGLWVWGVSSNYWRYPHFIHNHRICSFPCAHFSDPPIRYPAGPSE